jgi:Host cell surface-exposed lipoprotein
MTDSEDFWRPWNPQQGPGQQYQQEQQGWQPKQYDPNAHQQRLQPPQQSPRPPQDQQWWREEEERQTHRLPPSYPPPPQYGQQPGWDQPPQQPYPQQQPPQPGPPSPRRRKSWPGQHKLLSGLIAAGAIVIIAVATSASNKPSTPTANTGAIASSASSSAAVSSAPASKPSTPTANTGAIGSSASSSAAVSSAPASSAPSTPAAPASPSMTVAQEQAVDAAEAYLSEGQGFSREGLLGQLTSSAANGFEQADAEFAINDLNPNWDAQAVDAASGYLSEGQGFSQQGLVQQLTSSAGSGFTEAQAEYAISSVHPDWDAQAVDAAKGYTQMGGFSQASLIQQLTSSAGSGFTQAQAEYAASQVGL